MQRFIATAYATSLSIASEKFGRDPETWSAENIRDLLGLLSERAPAFFKQLRMDVSAMYLSDARVWGTIGFPGPSYSARWISRL